MRKNRDINEIKTRVEKIQENFTYTEIYPNHWVCKAPDTHTYCFEIVVGKFQIYMGGDIDALVFRVGADYGIGFLAGDDINYYIYSKLDHVYQNQTDVDNDAVKDYLDGLELGVDSACEMTNDYDKSSFEDFKEEILHSDNLNEIYSIIYNSDYYDGEMPDIETPKYCILFGLYMINHAAKMICKKAQDIFGVKTIEISIDEIRDDILIKN